MTSRVFFSVIDATPFGVSISFFKTRGLEAIKTLLDAGVDPNLVVLREGYDPF
jgi:hypothetical protein